MQLLRQHTRRKIRMCRATDVPRRLPSQLRSHKLSLPAGLDAWAFADTQSYLEDLTAEAAAVGVGGGGGGGGVEVAAAAGGGGGGGVGSALSVADSDLLDGGMLVVQPFTPRTPHAPSHSRGGGGRGGPGALRRFKWRRGGGGGGGLRTNKDGAGSGTGSSRRLMRARHGAIVAFAVGLVSLFAYFGLLQWLLPSHNIAEPLFDRLAAAVLKSWVASQPRDEAS